MCLGGIEPPLMPYKDIFLAIKRQALMNPERIELSFLPYQGSCLAINIWVLMLPPRFELRCSGQEPDNLPLIYGSNAPEGTRTPNILLKRQML